MQAFEHAAQVFLNVFLLTSRTEGSIRYFKVYTCVTICKFCFVRLFLQVDQLSPMRKHWLGSVLVGTEHAQLNFCIQKGTSCTLSGLRSVAFPSSVFVHSNVEHSVIKKAILWTIYAPSHKLRAALSKAQVIYPSFVFTKDSSSQNNLQKSLTVSFGTLHTPSNTKCMIVLNLRALFF